MYVVFILLHVKSNKGNNTKKKNMLMHCFTVYFSLKSSSALKRIKNVIDFSLFHVHMPWMNKKIKFMTCPHYSDVSKQRNWISFWVRLITWWYCNFFLLLIIYFKEKVHFSSFLTSTHFFFPQQNLTSRN